MNWSRRQVISVMAGSVAFSLSSARPHRGFIARIDVADYDYAVVPRGHGLRIALGKRYRARYPSRDQNMQLMAFFGKKGGLLVRTLDSTAGVTDWKISPSRILTIQGFGEESQVLAEPVGTDLSEIAQIYREWAESQFWTKDSVEPFQDYRVFAVASQASEKSFDRGLFEFLEKVPGPKACWLTQWRKDRFDRGFPNYVSRARVNWEKIFDRLENYQCDPYPYVNASLVDIDRKGGGMSERLLLRDANGELVPYSKRKKHLNFCCPEAGDWRATVTGALDELSQTAGRPIEGVYYDVLTATNPRICYASDHDHEPGDPYSWQRGTAQLLTQTDRAIMAEACAEIYINLVGASLMHRYTDSDDAVPLWSAVYGDFDKSFGWDMRRIERIEEVEKQVKKAKRFGVRACGSPWMTERIQKLLLSEPSSDVWGALGA